jgi:hypothetical protein
VSDSNDWRVTITLTSPDHAGRAHRSLSGHAVEADVRSRLGGGIVVGSGKHQVFLYAGSEMAALEAERVARDVLGQEGIDADFALHRWHPVEEEWESSEVAMPRTQAQRQAEHQRLEDEETAASMASGFAQWEARVELPSHREAVALADKLRDEGWPVVRRWKFLVVFANNEDDASAAAEQIRREAPPDATVRAEPSPSNVGVPFMSF